MVMLPEGWLRTGDIGRMDERGYVFIEDRKKDMILVSGFNVYPNEVEAVVAAIPGVVEAAAVAQATSIPAKSWRCLSWPRIRPLPNAPSSISAANPLPDTNCRGMCIFAANCRNPMWARYCGACCGTSYLQQRKMCLGPLTKRVFQSTELGIRVEIARIFLHKINTKPNSNRRL